MTLFAPFKVPIKGNSFGKPKVIDLPRGRFEIIRSSAILPDGRFVFGSSAGCLYFYEPRSGETIKKIAEHKGSVLTLQTNKKGDRLYSLGTNGDVVIWDLTTMEPTVRLDIVSPTEVLATTPEGYYTGNTTVQDMVHFVKDDKAYRLDQFELQQHRPDILLQRMGASEDDVATAHNAWLKRLKRRGYTADMLRPDFHAPQVVIANKDSLPTRTAARKIKLALQASDSLRVLRSVQLELNGVPQWGRDGEVLAGRNLHEWTGEVELELTSGDNIITFRAENENGTAALRDETSIECTAAEPAQHIYVATIGMSNYADPAYNLKFAAKDAADMSALLSQKADEIEKVHVLSLENEQFTRASLDAIRAFFAQAKREDAIILYYAGHGVIDDELDYFLATWDMDFSRPGATGVSMDDFSATMLASPALARYVVLDACHSGEIDKDDYVAATTMDVGSAEGQIVFRGLNSLKERSAEVARVNDVMQNHFIDYNTSVGAVVASSSAGMEVSIESGEYGNGLYTFCLKQAAEKDPSGYYYGDSNRDGVLTFHEALAYAITKVPQLSGGAQRPTVVEPVVTPNQLPIRSK